MAPFVSSERRVLAVAMVAGSLIPLNSTMIAVALPGLAADLDVRRGTAAILITAYLVAMLVCQPAAGRLGDRFGPKRVLAVAVTGFAIASTAAAIAPTFPLVLAARCIQAAFGASLIPNSQALLRITVDETRRGRAFGLVGSGIGAGAAVGPVVGGLLVEVSWRAIFGVNVVPLVVAAALLPGVTGRGSRDANEGEGDGSGRTGLRSVLRPPFFMACGAQSSTTFVLYTVLLVLPSLLTERRWSGAQIGLATAGLTVGSLVLAPIGGTLSDRVGRRVPIVVGLSVGAVGCAILAAGATSAVALVAGPVVMGVGMGISGASLQAAALEAVPTDIVASAAGLFSTSRYVGSIISSSLVAAIGVDGVGNARPLLAATVCVALAAVAAGGKSV